VLPLNQDQAKATITATVTTCPSEGSSPPAGVEVTFEVKAPAAGSAEAGGHAHDTRPLHAFGSFTQAKGPKTATCTVTTFDAEGMGSCTVPYHASEISGVETIVAQAPGFTEAKATVRVAVPGLTPMPESALGAWRLTGATGSHPGNHYGTPETTTRIAAIATDYFEATGIAIGINDMSLERGGLFDIGPPYGPFWSTPHKRHRTGRSVDVDHLGVKEKRLNAIAVEQYGCKRFEVDRIHYECP